jgi:hypothetical protein
VTCGGRTHQVLIFSPEGKPVGTLGEPGGVFSGRPGEVTPLKFHNPVGVGVDRDGSVVVASNGTEGRPHTEVRKLRPDGTQAWELLALEFVDVADADPATDGESIHTKNRRYTMDWNAPAGRGWRYAGATLDPHRFPEDPRLHIHHPGGVQVRRVHGEKFLYVHHMHSRWLAVYRFEDDAETAIPCALFTHQNTLNTQERWPRTQPTAGRWIWIDRNGDGKMDASEFMADGPDDTLQWGWWVDEAGDIWTTSRANGIRRYRVGGVDPEHGFPIYNPHAAQVPADAQPMPTGFTQVCRTIYLPASDTMFVAGFTAEKPYEKRHGQGPFGTVIARFDGWSTGDPRETWRFDAAFYAEKPDGSGFISAPKAWAAAGGRLYYSDVKTGAIREHDSATGNYLRTIVPGPEVNGGTGWHDIPHALNAFQRVNGERILFAEEDWKCKVLVYRDKSGVVR